MSRWRWFRSGWDTAISLPLRIFIRIWTTLPRFLRQKRCWTGLEWVQIRKKTLKKVWFLSKTGRFLSCYEIVKLKNPVLCIKKRYKVLKKARCTVNWRSIRDLNSGGATNALSHFECDPFDLLGNAPYSNLPKSSPEKGEKSRREQQIFNCRKQWIFDDGSLENQWQLPKCLLDFESISLRPLRYVCLFSFYRTASHNVWKNARFRCKITMKSWVRDTR